jgi:hypothetical protein
MKMRNLMNLLEAAEIEQLSPAEIEADEEARQDAEDAASMKVYEREKKIEQAVTQFCKDEIGFDFEGSRSVSYDSEHNELTISPLDEEATLEQMMKLQILGSVKVSGSSGYGIVFTINTPENFNVSQG